MVGLYLEKSERVYPSPRVNFSGWLTGACLGSLFGAKSGRFVLDRPAQII